MAFTFTKSFQTVWGDKRIMMGRFFRMQIQESYQRLWKIFMMLLLFLRSVGQTAVMNFPAMQINIGPSGTTALPGTIFFSNCVDGDQYRILLIGPA